MNTAAIIMIVLSIATQYFMFKFFKDKLYSIDHFYKDTLTKSCQKNNYDIESLNVRLTLLEEAIDKLNKKKK